MIIFFYSIPPFFPFSFFLYSFKECCKLFSIMVVVLKVYKNDVCSLLESIEETSTFMIKEYNFPNIFQNVLGNVIPNHLLDRLGDSYLQGRHHLSDNQSVSMTSESFDQPFKTNIFWVKSKKKKLLRRATCTKTMNNFTYRMPCNKENNQINTNSKFSNFLRKKSAELSSHQSETQRENFRNQYTQLSIEETQKQSQQHLIMKTVKQSKRNFLKVRTSIDSPIFMDEIIQDNQDGIARQILPQYDESSSSIIPFDKDKSSQEGSLSQLLDYDEGEEKPNKNKVNEKQQQKSSSRLNKSSKVFKDSNNKKTVLFSVNPSSPTSSTTKFKKRFISTKKGTIFSNYSREKQSTSRSKSRKKMERSRRFNDDTSSKYSKWTGKSVVSIKFDEQSREGPKSKKSLRSNQSVFNSDHNIMFKGRTKNRARTVKFMKNTNASQKRLYKTLEIIEDQNQHLHSHKSILKKTSVAHSKKSLHSQKSLTKSQKKILYNLKSKGSRVSLLRKQEPYLLEEDIYGQSFKSLYTLKDALRKNKSHKSLKANIRHSIDNSNVYNELNNFIKFFHESQSVEGDQIKRTFTKPIIIPDETHFRDRNNNKEVFDSQNLCIDMGLKLVRKMNKLKQKKI